MKIQLDHNTHAYNLELAQRGKTASLTFEGQTYTAEILRAGDGWLDICLTAPKTIRVFAFVSRDGPKRWVTVNGQTFLLTQPTGLIKRGGHARLVAGALTAPMPGQIRAMQVAEGDSVSKGQTLVIIEAMKMEIKVAAPFDGTIKSLKVQPGQTVEKDELLLEMESKIRAD